jgi:hypothetical protein
VPAPERGGGDAPAGPCPVATSSQRCARAITRLIEAARGGVGGTGTTSTTHTYQAVDLLRSSPSSDTSPWPASHGRA